MDMRFKATEMIQATGEVGTQWILDLCNGIVKEGSIPETGNQAWYCQSTNAKVTLWSVDLIEGLNWSDQECDFCHA